MGPDLQLRRTWRHNGVSLLLLVHGQLVHGLHRGWSLVQGRIPLTLTNCYRALEHLISGLLHEVFGVDVLLLED